LLIVEALKDTIEAEEYIAIAATLLYVVTLAVSADAQIRVAAAKHAGGGEK
jgi:hypothetical protein